MWTSACIAKLCTALVRQAIRKQPSCVEHVSSQLVHTADGCDNDDSSKQAVRAVRQTEKLCAGGIMKCDVIAAGIVSAAKEVKALDAPRQLCSSVAPLLERFFQFKSFVQEESLTKVFFLKSASGMKCALSSSTVPQHCPPA